MQKKLLIGILISLILLASITFASEIVVHVSGGVEKIDAFDENNVTYLSFSQLTEIFGEIISWDIIGLSMFYESSGHRTYLYINSPYINVDDTVKNLIYPVKFVNGNAYLPAITFIPVLDIIKSEQITWDNGRKTIRIDSEWFNITDISISPKANGSLIEIFVTTPKNYEIYLSEGNWLNVTIPDGTVNLRKVLSRRANKLLRDLNAFQFESSAQISFRFRKPIDKYSHRFQANPGRIQISLIDTTKEVVHNIIDKVGPDDIIDKIIIDPGHGGDDYGAIGLDKTGEKKIVLDIAKRLAKLIRKEKIFQVVMTREKDSYVSLEKRAELANSSEGDLFISIHANASPNRSARGFQVFFLAPANNDEARAAAQLENAIFLSEMNSSYDDEDGDPLSLIISDMIQTEFQTESADLAAMIDKEFRKNLSKDTRARGMDQAGFVVLNNVYMPSVLIESAFLTNKNDEKLLNSRKYRQQIAEAIYAGIKRFKAKYEKN
jgi:N-acetylmuramoyl-L-alanine amidase